MMIELINKSGVLQNRRSGMALVIVLGFTAVLLILGTSYLKTFSHGQHLNVKHLSQLQADFFAQGIERIALFKYKKFSPHFYRAYRYQVLKDSGANMQHNYNPTPLEMFHGMSPNPLQNSSDKEFIEPLAIASYTTKYSLTKINEFQRDVLEIKITMRFIDDPQTYEYKSVFDASRTALLEDGI